MTSRLAMRCTCGMEFTVPGTVSIGALVPCPRCTQTLRVSSVPVAKATARPAASHAHARDHEHRPPAYRGPRKRLGVPAAPGHVSIRSDQSEVLVNYGLWTLLLGIFSTLTPLLPIQHHAWDSFISYQPYGGIIIATCGVMMMIVYQSGPDFARGPGGAGVGRSVLDGRRDDGGVFRLGRRPGAAAKRRRLHRGGESAGDRAAVAAARPLRTGEQSISAKLHADDERLRPRMFRQPVQRRRRPKGLRRRRS